MTDGIFFHCLVDIKKALAIYLMSGTNFLILILWYL